MTAPAWLAALAVALVGAVIRIVNLASPNGEIFDEVHYVGDANDMLTHGVEWDVKGNGPAYVVHPPLGKWMIALGIKVFGYDSFGWRIGAAVVGVVTILMITRIAQRLFGSAGPGLRGGAADGLRRHALRAFALRPARHLPDVLRAGRLRRARARPRPAPAALGQLRRRRRRPQRPRPGQPATLRRAVVAPGLRGAAGLRDRGQVERAGLPARAADPGDVVGDRRAATARCPPPGASTPSSTSSAGW